jgi:asparagine N-glycosylation enzyme membrane subunit Stt3
MPEVLPSRTRAARNYTAIAVFIVVYLVVLGLVFAPKDMIAVQTGAVFVGGD